ncbi:MAG: hypothetical protein WBC22_12670 [Sedimentisphaerales bacterium]
MSEEERKEKRYKTKVTIRSLLVALSCLFFILALITLCHSIHCSPTPNNHYLRSCMLNLRELGIEMLIYANDYDGMLPTPSKWCDLLIEHRGVTKKQLKCPCAKGGPCNYAMNKNVEKLGLDAPPDMVLLFETYPGWNQYGGPELLTLNNHKGKGANVLFNNGRVLFITPQEVEIDKLKWKPDEVQQE